MARDGAGLIGALNSAGASAPEGGLPPYAAAADNANGVVGIVTSNTGVPWTTGQTVTITTPAYLELGNGAQQTVVLTYN